MSQTKKKPKGDDNTIAQNRKARHEYQILDTYEAGLVLEGWEVKSLREGKINLSDTYVLLRDGEAFLLACRIEPLKTVSNSVPVKTNPAGLSKLCAAWTRPRIAARTPA